MSTKLLQWVIAVTIMIIQRVECMDILFLFTSNWKIFMISVVYGYCIILTAQILCLNTLDRAPHQVILSCLYRKRYFSFSHLEFVACSLWILLILICWDLHIEQLFWKHALLSALRVPFARPDRAHAGGGCYSCCRYNADPAARSLTFYNWNLTQWDEIN